MNELEKEVLNQYNNKCFSVRQIADGLKLSPSKVRYILGKLGVKRRNISEAIRHLNITKFNKGIFSIKSNLDVREEQLKIAGVMLDWGEGTKGGNSVVLSNSNPDMILLFLRFLRKVCNVYEGRVRILLHFYEDQDETKLKEYWSDKMGIPMNQFSKSFLHKNKRGTYRKKSDFGTVSLRYSDKELLRLINGWIKEYAEKL